MTTTVINLSLSPRFILEFFSLEEEGMFILQESPIQVFCIFFPVLTLLALKQVSLTFAGRQPKIENINDDKKILFASLGKAVTLRCPVEYESHLFIEWAKGNISLYLEEGYEVTSKGFLKIRAVTVRDEGLYTCFATNGFGTANVNITLIVDGTERENVLDNLNHSSVHLKHLDKSRREKPIIKKTGSKDFEEEAGGSVDIHCTASGYPAPHILFVKDGHLVGGPESEVKKTPSRTRSILSLRKLSKSDAGVYRCIAKNNVGEDQFDFNLHVTDSLFPPKIVSLKPSELTVLATHTAMFKCEVNSMPGTNLRFKWLKSVTDDEIQRLNRTFRLGSSYYQILETKNEIRISGGHYESKMQISKARPVDSGIFICLAVNDKGYTFKNVSLTVIQTEISMASSSSSLTTNSTFLVSIVLSAAVVLGAVLFAIFLYCKCQTSRKSGSSEAASAEAENLTGLTAPAVENGQKPVIKHNIRSPINCEYQNVHKPTPCQVHQSVSWFR